MLFTLNLNSNLNSWSAGQDKPKTIENKVYAKEDVNDDISNYLYEIFFLLQASKAQPICFFLSQAWASTLFGNS
jgi:hypothetical protein